ncbi:hypothetical protein GEMRC1_009359 [Eukaryota sp. GEM-RC1]
MSISPTHFGIQLISLVSSTIHLEYSPLFNFTSFVLDSSELYYDVIDPGARLFIDSIYLKTTSSIISTDRITVTSFHWIDGELISSRVLAFKGLFLYGESNSVSLDSLVIETELFFNNSLTFSISHLNLITVSITCFPGSELILDTPSFNESFVEIKNALHVSSNCSLTSFLPVQSTGPIFVANDSVLCLQDNLNTTKGVVIFPKGELELINSIIILQESERYSHPDLFFYCSWIDSPNRIDLSGNHDSDTIIINGPKWKRDGFGGYMDITPGDTLHIPNILGTQGWRDATISLWVYWEEGGMGFDFGIHSSCQFWIRRHHIGWGRAMRSLTLPLREWFHLVIVTTGSRASVYVNGVFRINVSPSHPWYFCNNGPPSYFSLTEVTNNDNWAFEGKVRAVQIFRKTLTFAERQDLDYTTLRGITGRGKVSLVSSEATLSSSMFDLKTISLSSSTLHLNNLIIHNLLFLELFDDSLVILDEDSTIISDEFSVTLSSSELYFDDSVDMIISTFSLIAINSHFHNDFDFDSINVLDLSYSTFESGANAEIIIGCLYCFHCQILGNSSLLLQLYSEINSGNFSSSFIFAESILNSSIIGTIQLSNSFEFFNHVILDDVSVSEFQSSSNGSITCHSDVLMRKNVAIYKVSFIYHAILTLYDSTLLFDPLL